MGSERVAQSTKQTQNGSKLTAPNLKRLRGSTALTRELRDGIGINREKRERFSMIDDSLTDLNAKQDDQLSLSSKLSIAVKSQYSYAPSQAPSVVPS
jgi:hypothetical protein